MSLYTGDPKYNGTMKRALALVLGYELIFGEDGRASLRDSAKGLDGVVDRLIASMTRLNPDISVMLEPEPRPESNFYKVTGDHPILARPDKSGLTKDEANTYATELRRLGFSNVTITRLVWPHR